MDNSFACAVCTPPPDHFTPTHASYAVLVDMKERRAKRTMKEHGVDGGEGWSKRKGEVHACASAQIIAALSDAHANMSSRSHACATVPSGCPSRVSLASIL